jgi:hypothetical protein
MEFGESALWGEAYLAVKERIFLDNTTRVVTPGDYYGLRC